ncbi:MAG TPA: hypothetical protein VFS77_03570 [Pyrinomonadaceae bacterium]|nr:hypothetical protein [Pyrinomonadaceae bacterium]
MDLFIVAGIPQIVPAVGNVNFDGPGANEDLFTFSNEQSHIDQIGVPLKNGTPMIFN